MRYFPSIRMLVMIIAASLIGPSLNASLNRSIRSTTYMLGVRCGRARVLESDAGRVPVNCTGDKQRTRHSTRKDLQLKTLTIQYKRDCNNSNSVECVQLFRKLVNGHVQRNPSDVKKVRSLLKDVFDFRLCLNGFDIVHFDTDTQICCNGVFNKTSGSEECCLGEIIDSSNQFCCNGIIHNRTESHDCCGTYQFDTRINICCSGLLYPKLPGATCCGNDVFNKQTQICCFKSYKFNLTEGNACCGTSVYNMSTDTCCQNSVQPAYGRKNRKGACCKDKSYHAECFRCENNAQLVAVFNESSEVCCEGTIRKKKYGNKTGCCWRKVMHKEKQRCYYKELIEKALVTQIATFHPEILATFHPEEDTTVLLILADGAASASYLEYAHFGIIIVGGLTLLSAGCAVLCIVNPKHRTSKQALVNENYSCRSIGIYDISEPTLPLSELTLPQSEPTLSLSELTLSCDYSQPNNTILLNKQTEEGHIPDDLECSNEIDLLYENLHLEDHFFDYVRFMQNCNIAKSDTLKASLVCDANFISSHFKDSYTQTWPEKACNRRTIFGKPFEHNYMLGISNSTIQMPNSEVKMTLPHSILRHSKVEVNSTSFKIISQLRKKLGLGDAEALASPVVEYAVTGIGLLTEYAVVVIPFIGSTTDLEVRKFQSDEGLNMVVKSTYVPLQEKTTGDLETFYILKDSHVYIYTKSFSGFYCTTCRHRLLRLRCFLFGSYKRFTNPLRHEVRIMTYFADDLMKYSDYNKRMLTNENAEGRVLKKEMQLQLPSELTETDEIQVSVAPTESHYGQWIHKLYPGEQTPIYNELQAVTIGDVAEKCKDCPHCHLPEHDIPHGMEWYLTNVEGILPSYAFQCIVNVDIVGRKNGTKTGNRIVIDELQLRQEDRLPVEEEFYARCIRGIKEYLARVVLHEKRDAVLRALLSKYSCIGSSVEEVFFHLLEKLTPKGVMEAVVTALRSNQMFEELDALQKYGFVSCGLAFSAVQPVNEAATEETNSNSCSEELSAAVVNASDMMKPGCVQASTETGQCRSNTNNSERCIDKVRPELSNTLRTTCFSQSAADIPILDRRHARGELSTRSLNPTTESNTLHIQEIASLDNTALKTPKRRTE